MNYPQALEFLYHQLPMFQRAGPPAYKSGLDNTIAICSRLRNPEKRFRSVHVAGTNGKGSVSHFIASILQARGYKTGLFTSPHLKDFRERIRVNGIMIPEKAVTDFVNRYRESFSDLNPSFFEYTFGMAMDFFAGEQVDVAVVETGMGGRLDSTNVVDSVISVITNIGFDHMMFLGNSLEQIGREKAGIIKPGVPVVIGETQTEVSDVFVRTASQHNAPLFFADRYFRVAHPRLTGKSRPFLRLDILDGAKTFLEQVISPLTGWYQIKNLVTVAQTIKLLESQGYPVGREAMRAGIRQVIRRTGIKGRWQRLGNRPKVICDTAHNKEGFLMITEQIRNTPFRALHMVVGMVNDKDHESMLRLLPSKARYYFCRPDVPRGLADGALKQMASRFGLEGECYGSVRLAFDDALKNARPDDLIFIGGSTFVVAEVV
ncbi:MAG: bifunctional folylpolyglutamate synthase/dihydrofolate synthase [Bacteroidales bacterium]|nr:bifunctional folylpolyglutamate synthase/dihydrofolate synthase [Bacteroidales bacterium]